MEKIGMIGTGAMGLALLERLKLAGVDAVCYDAYAPAQEQAGALGMRTVGSSAEVAAESTLIDIVVRTDEDMIGLRYRRTWRFGECAAGNSVVAAQFDTAADDD